MKNNDWIKTGEDIFNSVMDAVEKKDFSGLSRDIENKVNDALGQAGNATQEWMAAKQRREAEAAAKIKKEKQQLALYQKNPPGTYSGTALQVVGIVGLSIFGLANVVLTGVAVGTGVAGVWLANTIVGAFTAGSAVMTSCGAKLRGRVKRFRTYVKHLGDKQYCQIDELANAVGKTSRFVKREVRQMIRDNFFLQGHIDQGGQTLITSHEVYDQYLDAEASRRERERIEMKQAEDKARMDAQNRSYPKEVQEILQEGERYIQHIHAANDAIPGEAMSQKLETLENIMKRIFEQLKKNPGNADDLQKLMNYYLPTTSKLLDAYIEMDSKPAYGSKNIETTKKEIEDTLDVINAAFSKLLDDMFEETAWDISADISTMKTMLAKEGLTGERDFESF